MYKDKILGVKSTDEIFSLISVMIDDLVVNMNLNAKADKKNTEYAIFLYLLRISELQQRSSMKAILILKSKFKNMRLK